MKLPSDFLDPNGFKWADLPRNGDGYRLGWAPRHEFTVFLIDSHCWTVMQQAIFVMTDSSPPTIRSILVAAFRQNRFPALILQLFAAGILLLYFGVPGLRPFFEGIGEFKNKYGTGLSVFSTVIFGGVIPWIVLVHRGRIQAGNRLKDLCFYIGFWALQGFMVDRLYTYQDIWFGSEPSVKVVLIKVIVDQLPYNLIWATPNCLLFFGWKNSGYDWVTFWGSLGSRDLARKYLTLQISAWTVWVPAVMMIYSLPPDLQIPLFNLVLCFFSLVLTFVSRSAS